MTLKANKVAPALAPAAVPAVRRIYMDLTGTVDAQLEVAAKAAGLTKKGFVERLILAAVEQARDEAAGQRKRK